MEIVYLSHVDSKWIKQRPHFLAEALDRVSDGVVYVDSLLVLRRHLVRGQRLQVAVRHVPLLPQRFRGRMRLLDLALSTLSALLLIVRFRPRHAIVTHPRHLHVARMLKRCGVRISYDCMDLNLQFSDSTRSDAAGEEALIALASDVFCSSAAIESDVVARVPGSRTTIVRNALSQSAGTTSAGSVDSGVVRYVGTVSTWFDMDIVLEALEELPDMTVELIGPVDVDVPQHPRLVVRGAVPHDRVMPLMRSADALVMPFVVTPLIAGVDPVKVYEYIASERPTVCVRYDELEHFGSLIETYETTSEFVDALRSALGSPARTGDDVREFLARSNWDNRAALVKTAIDR